MGLINTCVKYSLQDYGLTSQSLTFPWLISISHAVSLASHSGIRDLTTYFRLFFKMVVFLIPLSKLEQGGMRLCLLQLSPSVSRISRIVKPTIGRIRTIETDVV
jgi:hypothetical protein